MTNNPNEIDLKDLTFEIFEVLDRYASASSNGVDAFKLNMKALTCVVAVAIHRFAVNKNDTLVKFMRQVDENMDALDEESDE